MREKFKQLGKESLIYGLSGMLQKFLAVLLLPLFWNVFDPDETGQQALVVTAITLLSALAVLGLDSATAIWYWQTEDEDDRRTTIASWFWCQLAVSLLMGGLLAVFAEPVSVLISGDSSATFYLRLASCIPPLSVSSGILINYLRLRRRPAATLWFTAATTLLLVGLNGWFILGLHWGVAGFFLAQIAAGVAGTVAAVWLLRHTIQPAAARMPRLREMLRYSLPLMPAALALWVMSLSDRYFIRTFLDITQVGLYDAGAKLATAVAMITGAFTAAWGPFALSMQRQADAPVLYARALLVYLAVGGTMVAVVALFAPEAFMLLAKPGYFSAASVSGILCLGVLANGLATVASTGLALAKKSASISAATFLAAAVSMALNVLLIPLFGKTGSAWASAATWTVYSSYIFMRAQRIYPLPYDLSRTLVLGALLAGMVVVAPYLNMESWTAALLVKSAAVCVFAALLFTVALSGWRRHAAVPGQPVPN